MATKACALLPEARQKQRYLAQQNLSLRRSEEVFMQRWPHVELRQKQSTKNTTSLLLALWLDRAGEKPLFGASGLLANAEGTSRCRSSPATSQKKGPSSNATFRGWRCPVKTFNLEHYWTEQTASPQIIKRFSWAKIYLFLFNICLNWRWLAEKHIFVVLWHFRTYCGRKSLMRTTCAAIASFYEDSGIVFFYRFIFFGYASIGASNFVDCRVPQNCPLQKLINQSANSIQIY